MDPSNYLTRSPNALVDNLPPLSPRPSTSAMSVSSGYSFPPNVPQELMSDVVFPDPEPCFNVITDEHLDSNEDENKSMMGSILTYLAPNSMPPAPATSSPLSYPSQGTSAASPQGRREGNVPMPRSAGSAAASVASPGSDSQRIGIHRARFLRTTQLLTDSGLIGVTVKLANILKQNEAVENELRQLQQDTRNFLIDVLNNPENASLRPFFEAKGYVPPKT